MVNGYVPNPYLPDCFKLFILLHCQKENPCNSVDMQNLWTEFP